MTVNKTVKAHMRQSGPDSGLGSKAKFLETLEGVPSSLGNGKDPDVPIFAFIGSRAFQKVERLEGF